MFIKYIAYYFNMYHSIIKANIIVYSTKIYNTNLTS